MKYSACVLIEIGNKILGVSRKDDTTVFGLPGGKVEKNEIPIQAASRELEEETGIVILPFNLKLVFAEMGRRSFCFTFRPKKLLLEYDALNVQMRYFTNGKCMPSLISSEEGEAKWVSKETLMDGPFGKYNRKLFNYLYIYE